MNVQLFSKECKSALITLRSVYFGSRDILLSDAVSAAETVDELDNVLDYFDAFKSYTKQALQAYRLKEEDVENTFKELFVKYELLAQLSRQKRESLQVQMGETPIYSSH